jgi:hypothetical protein
MRYRPLVLIVALGISGIVASGFAPSQGTQKPDHAGMHVYQGTDLQWKDGPGSLPAGARFAVLEGDPMKEGPFTMRLQLRDGYRIPPHFHGGVEHVTVISGTFNLGMGETFSEAGAKAMTAGAFGYWPAGMRHFAWTKGETTLQLHGMGPWTITYVNASDDPRKK